MGCKYLSQGKWEHLTNLNLGMSPGMFENNRIGKYLKDHPWTLSLRF